jgi:predicted transcriptional regulator
MPPFDQDKKSEETYPCGSAAQDLRYRQYVLSKLRSGEQDIREGRYLTHEQLKSRLKRWLSA